MGTNQLCPIRSPVSNPLRVSLNRVDPGPLVSSHKSAGLCTVFLHTEREACISQTRLTAVGEGGPPGEAVRLAVGAARGAGDAEGHGISHHRFVRVDGAHSARSRSARLVVTNITDCRQTMKHMFHR